MFEGKPPRPAQADAESMASQKAEDLRALSWSDLVAKLTAARELRASLAAARELPMASFDANSARHLAATHDLDDHLARHADDQDDHTAVNLDASANRKEARGITVGRNSDHRTATRGNT